MAGDSSLVADAGAEAAISTRTSVLTGSFVRIRPTARVGLARVAQRGGRAVPKKPH